MNNNIADCDSSGNSAAEQSACQGCPHTDQCRDVWGAARRGPFSAAGLSLGSAAAFLLPWVTAIAGAVVVRGFEAERAGFSAGQALGALGGLLLGGVGAWLVMPMIRKWFGADADDGPGSGG